jgi:SpoIID/LytB domain protein
MRRALAGLTAIIVGIVGIVPLAGPAAAVTTAEVVTVPPNGAVTIAGRGFGHGKGLSQWGSRAAAASGVGYSQILDFYYPGTQAVTQGNASIKVLISADTDNEFRVLAVPGMTASDAVSTNTPIGFTDATPSQWRVIRSSAGFLLEGLVGSSWRRWSQGASPGFLSLAAPSGFIRLILPGGSQKDYRGTVRAVPHGAAPGQRTVNVLPMEAYLRSVVPAESPSSWPADALAAQAVAARTYASWERAGATGQWQTCDTTQCQVYPGHKSFDSSGRLVTNHEAASTDAAVARTAGQVRHYGGKLAFTQFSASNGGWTAPGTVPYQVARRDTWDPIGNPSHRWSATLRSSTVQALYPQIGTLKAIEVRSRNGYGEWGGRVSEAVLRGTRAAVTLTGAQFRTAFGLRSDWWKVTGSTRLESDTTSDGRADLLAQPTDGRLVVYRGDGTGRFPSSAVVGGGWTSMRLAIRANDLNGDGTGDLLAVDGSGQLWRYPGTSASSFGARSLVGTGWQVMRHLIGAGDVGRDGTADLLAIDDQGRLWLYPGRGNGTFAARVQVGSGWGAMTAVLPAGDWDRDGYVDLLARDTAGRLLLYRGDGRLSFHAPVTIGTGWNVMRLIVATSDLRTDGIPDLVAADTAGRLFLYPWTGSAFGTRVQIGSGWNTIARML